jgi:hypothetical protein
MGYDTSDNPMSTYGRSGCKFEIPKADRRRIALLECLVSDACRNAYTEFADDGFDVSKPNAFPVLTELERICGGKNAHQEEDVEEQEVTSSSWFPFMARTVASIKPKMSCMSYEFSFKRAIRAIWRMVKKHYAITASQSRWTITKPAAVSVFRLAIEREAAGKAHLKDEVSWLHYVMYSTRSINIEYVLCRLGFGETAELARVYVNNKYLLDTMKTDFENYMTLQGKGKRVYGYPLPKHISSELANEFIDKRLQDAIERRGISAEIKHKYNPTLMSLITVIDILYQVRWMKEANEIFDRIDGKGAVPVEAEPKERIAFDDPRFDRDEYEAGFYSSKDKVPIEKGEYLPDCGMLDEIDETCVGDDEEVM